MALETGLDGTIKIYQGDSGEITVNGLFEPIYKTEQVIDHYEEQETQVRKTIEDETLGELSIFSKDNNTYGVVTMDIGENIYLLNNNIWVVNSTIKAINDTTGDITNENDEILTVVYEIITEQIPIYTTITTDEITNPKYFNVYFEVQDAKRNVVFVKQLTNNGKPSVTFKLTPADTDLLEVPINKNYVTYFYGIKACETGTTDEDTLFVGGKTYGAQNRMIVYPKQAEGNK